MAINISEISIRAPKEKVWKTLTDPALVKRWQYGSELITSWQPGTEIKFNTAWNGEIFRQWGTVLLFQPTDKLEYNLFAPRPDLDDKPENYFLMRYILTEEDGNSLLEIVQEDHRPGAKQEPLQGAENPVLKMLIEVAESQD